MLERGAFLIVDRVVLPQVGRVESRMHTFAEVQTAGHGALLRGQSESLRVAYACSMPALFCTATTAPTTPTEQPATVLRWCTEEQVHGVTMATLLAPGAEDVELTLTQEGAQVTIAATSKGWRAAFTLAPDEAGTPQLKT